MDDKLSAFMWYLEMIVKFEVNLNSRHWNLQLNDAWNFAKLEYHFLEIDFNEILLTRSTQFVKKYKINKINI